AVLSGYYSLSLSYASHSQMYRRQARLGGFTPNIAKIDRARCRFSAKYADDLRRLHRQMI
ncbi:MAG: hypothetical protein MUR46_06250, partial [Loktanella sp.]|nr:hypothetical protein [Loktanella sp.]